MGLVPASLLFGPFYRAVNPVRTVHLILCRLARQDPDRGLLPMSRRVGCWPAAFGLFAFVWLELVYPTSTYLGPIRLWFAGYLTIGMVGAAVFGARWLAAFDPFEVYSTLVGHLSVFGRRTDPAFDDALVVRTPLRNLDGVPVRPGLVAVIAVLLGSTAFDSFKDSNTWLTFIQGTDLNSEVVNTVALLAFCVAVAVTFAAATIATGVDGLPRGRSRTGSRTPSSHRRRLHHRALSVLLRRGRTADARAALRPTGQRCRPARHRDLTVNYWLSTHPVFLAVVKVLAIVTGHVLGVIASHDRAIRLLPKRDQLTGQLPLLLVMVAYTATDLYLLFGA